VNGWKINNFLQAEGLRDRLRVKHGSDPGKDWRIILEAELQQSSGCSSAFFVQNISDAATPSE